MDAIVLHVALAAAGIGAGVINTMAGGGSMLTLPALMLLGLPADVANGTNRVAVVSQSVSGVWGYRRAGKLHARGIGPTLIPTLLGSLAGAVAASRVPPAILEWVLLGTMAAVAGVMAVFPNAVTAADESAPRWSERRLAGAAGLFFAGVYGGFVQAGVGFLLIAVLGGILRYDIHGANALKLVCTLMFGVVALTVFAVAGQVDWTLGPLLAVYTVIGSLIGVRTALRLPAVVIRWVIFVAVVASLVAAYFD